MEENGDLTHTLQVRLCNTFSYRKLVFQLSCDNLRPLWCLPEEGRMYCLILPAFRLG